MENVHEHRESLFIYYNTKRRKCKTKFVFYYKFIEENFQGLLI